MKATIKICASYAKMADFIREFLACRTAKLRAGCFLDIALSGGNTPVAVFRALAQHRDKIHWDNYPAGSWGPPESAMFMERDGRKWDIF